MPQLEQEILPRYADQNLLTLAVASERSAKTAVNLGIDIGLKMPILLDFDRELFGAFRSPRRSFPLHVLLDRDGRIIHTDHGSGLAELEKALEKLFPMQSK